MSAGVGIGGFGKGGPNKVTVIGKETPDKSDRFRSSASDPTASAATGLNEVVIYLPTIDDQATLDAAAAAYLAAIQAGKSSDVTVLGMNQLTEHVILEVVDEYGTGAYAPEDWVTVTSPTLGLNGLYRIKRIERNMTDPNWARLDLTTRHTEYWELDENMRRTVRNLNTLV